mmetsp:Transcript_6978/g.19002  ORF Transcript_6978/g.19002 Transcript_6978/m.19002 type:complete len:214 (+) Transcript_6978:74-715(+)
MADIDFKQLAAEREARLRATGASPRAEAAAVSARTTETRRPPPSGVPRSFSSRASGGSGGAGPRAGGDLMKAHRSIRMAHSIALAAIFLSALLILLFGFSTTYLLVVAICAGLARSGGAMLHGCLPANLQEGAAPSQAQVDNAPKALFSPDGLRDFSAALSMEYSVLVENLAFACTYGKRNCLTNDMYSGELSLGKVAGLVWGKLSQGVLRCD